MSVRQTPVDPRKWSKLVWIETVTLLVIMVLMAVLIVVGVLYQHERVFTNVALILVFAALLAELIRRVRHIHLVDGETVVK